MRVVTIHQAKTNLSRLIKKASEGEEVIIARGSKPVARLVPVGEIKGKRQPGSLKGKLRVVWTQFLTASLASRPKSTKTSGPLRRLAAIRGTFCAG